MMINRILTLVCVTGLSTSALTGQEPPPQVVGSAGGEVSPALTRLVERVKVSGYMQAQMEYGGGEASLGVGGANPDPSQSYSRVGIRRGRLKATYTERSLSAVVQIDATERGMGLKEAYVAVQMPWLRALRLQVGGFDRPFGYEVGYSSTERETPERSRAFRALFPDTRDLGAMLSLRAPESSPWHVLRLDAGIFAGNGMKAEADDRRDFVGRVALAPRLGRDVSLSVGASYYRGSVYQGTDRVYSMQAGAFARDMSLDHVGGYARREYVGLDAQLRLASPLGKTRLACEWYAGTQPGNEKNSLSPNSASLPSHDIYIRPMAGGYAMLTQSLGKLPLTAVLRYDWYDPNTDLSTHSLATAGDVAYSTLGLGVVWDIQRALRLTLYYDSVRSERTTHLSGYVRDRDDDVLTVRLQYRF